MREVRLSREELLNLEYGRDIAPLLCERGAKAIERKMQKTGRRRISWHFIDGIHTMVEDDELDYLPGIKFGYKASIQKDFATEEIIYREYKE